MPYKLYEWTNEGCNYVEIVADKKTMLDYARRHIKDQMTNRAMELMRRVLEDDLGSIWLEEDCVVYDGHSILFYKEVKDWPKDEEGDKDD